MNLDELLTELSQRGVKLWAEGNQLRIRAPKGALTPELRDTLTARKADVLSLLLHHRSVAQRTVSIPFRSPSAQARRTARSVTINSARTGSGEISPTISLPARTRSNARPSS